ncbi:5'-3' exonuclease H3TH domain-containing protein [Catenulispora sp. MAP12-49]|uniref:5'-3' exonuclease n=1 Tax=Catenulispora sp. MAP12-49 TaxID=3156302 RepID=UPI003514742A
MVLDTPTLYFRAFFGVPDTIRSPDGMPVNAVRGTLDFVSHLIATYKPDRLVACFDADWRPAFRVEAIPSYKAHRVLEEAPEGVDVEEVPDILTPQVPVIEAALDALGIARAEAPGFEADDVLATLAERWSAGGHGPVDVVTMDRDLYQMVEDARGIRVLNIGKGVTKLEVVTDDTLREKYGITGGEYADFAALRGDPSDGLPGVAGIGEKTAAALISQYGDLAGVRAAAGDPASALKPAQRKRIIEAAGYLDAAPTVVRVVRDAPVAEHDDLLPREPKDAVMAEMLAEKFGLKGAVARLTKVMAER